MEVDTSTCISVTDNDFDLSIDPKYPDEPNSEFIILMSIIWIFNYLNRNIFPNKIPWINLVY